MLNEVYEHAKRLKMKIEDKEYVLNHFRSLIEKIEDPTAYKGVVVGGTIRYLPESVSITTSLLWEACVNSAIKDLQEDLNRLQAEFEDL